MMATIKIIKETIDICRKAHISLFIWGHRGMGKSSIVKQYAVSNNIGLIDLRCSQLEASDIRGLPDVIDGRTRYMPPIDMPVGGLSYEQISSRLEGLNGADNYRQEQKRLQPLYNEGILFLDEVNRAQDDVLQSIFELIYDQSIGQYVMPIGWSVIAAGNFMEGYLTNGFTDPAFLDRFCHITLSTGEATMDEWITYMTDVYGEDSADVIEFASHNVDHLDGKIKGDIGFSIQPSRRSWEMVNRVNILSKQYRFSPEAVVEVYAGLIGRDLALSFTKYSCPVKPKDLLSNGVKKYVPALNKLQRNQLCGLMWGLVASSKSQIEVESVANTCLDFAKYIVMNNREKDLAVAFCKALINDANNNDQVRAAAISNPHLAKLMSKFNKKTDNAKNFIDRLVEVPELQKALSNVCWAK